MSSSFDILDYARDHIENNLVRITAELLRKKYAQKFIFTCDQQSEEELSFSSCCKYLLQQQVKNLPWWCNEIIC